MEQKIRLYWKKILFFVILSFVLILVGAQFTPETPYSLSPLSRALVTGVIALIGLQQSLFFGTQRMRLHTKKRTLNSFIERVTGWRQELGLDRTLSRMYERAIHAWTQEMVRVDIPPEILYFYLIDFLMFIIAVIVSYSPELSKVEIAVLYSGKLWLSTVTFYVSLSFLIVLMSTHIEKLRFSTQVLIPKKGEGELWVRRINDTNFAERQDEIHFLVREDDALEIVVAYEGKATNGFFDTRVEFSNHTYVYVPDRNTFLCSFRFGWTRDHRPIMMLEELPFETGIIQGRCSFDDTQSTLVFGMRPNPRNNQDIGFFLNGEVRPVRLVIGIYEDPAFLPSVIPRGTQRDLEEPTRDRYRLDTVTVNLRYQNALHSE